MTYLANDSRTWAPGESVTGRQQPPSRILQPDRAAKDIVPGDALWDAGMGAWRGVTGVRIYDRDERVRFTFEDGGYLGFVAAAERFGTSETGLRGWSSGAAASAAFKAGKAAR